MLEKYTKKLEDSVKRTCKDNKIYEEWEQVR